MFHHEALLYDGPDEFLAGTLPFIREGFERGEPVLIALAPEKLEAVGDALGSSDAEFVDMRVLGHNPARIIPAWRDFRTRHDGPVRGIGEPIWAGRSGAELVECQLHEALLNVAFNGADEFKLLCPYDTSVLDESVIHEACAGHPHVDAQPSRAYRGAGAAAGAVRVAARASAGARARAGLRARHARGGAPRDRGLRGRPRAPARAGPRAGGRRAGRQQHPPRRRPRDPARLARRRRR